MQFGAGLDAVSTPRARVQVDNQGRGSLDEAAFNHLANESEGRGRWFSGLRFGLLLLFPLIDAGHEPVCEGLIPVDQCEEVCLHHLDQFHFPHRLDRGAAALGAKQRRFSKISAIVEVCDRSLLAACHALDNPHVTVANQVEAVRFVALADDGFVL